MRLDIIDMKHDFDSLAASSFIVGFPNTQLPNSQVLSSLNDGFMFNTGGIISTANLPLTNLTYNNIWIGDVNNLPVANPTILQSNLPNLTKNNIWIGDLNNRPQPNQTITIDNLPNLGVASITVPNPLDPTTPITISGGKIWHGTDSNRPEESTALLIVEGDIALINFRFLTANFIMGSGNLLLKTLMPFSQFLDTVPAGLLKQDIPGKIIQAVPGIDYLPGISQPPLPDISNFLLYGNNKVYQCPISYLEDPGGNGIFNFDGGTIKALNFAAKRHNGQDASVTVEGNAYISETIGARRIILYDSKELAHRREDGVMLEGPSPLPIGTMLKWIMPSSISTEGQILQDIGANIGGGRLLGFVNILPDGLTNTLLAQGEVGGKKTFVNATLTQNKIWVGDATNKPVETDLNFAPNDASYILKTPKIGLNNAQALSELIGGILKSAPITGTLSNAIAGIDYASEASVVAAQAAADAAAVEATAAATAAAAAPAAGAALAYIYFNEQMLPYSLIPLVPVGVSISGAIGVAAAAAASASSAASSAQTTANTAITRIDNLNVTLQGDIIGSGNLNNPVITTFTPNPRFTGKEYIKIPVGNTNERPSNSSVGMVRYNTDL
jgi:hypothetical protein